MSLDERLFSRERLQSWRELAERMGGEFQESAWAAGQVRISYRQWPLVLSTYRRPGHDFQYDTHVLVPFRAARSQHFALARRGLLSKAFEWLGFKGRKTGNALFDESYRLSAAPEEFLDVFLGREDLLKAVWALQPEGVYVLDSDFYHSFPSEHDLVDIVLRGAVSELPVLERALGLGALLVDLLEARGIASAEPPSEIYA